MKAPVVFHLAFGKGIHREERADFPHLFINCRFTKNLLLFSLYICIMGILSFEAKASNIKEL